MLNCLNYHWPLIFEIFSGIFTKKKESEKKKSADSDDEVFSEDESNFRSSLVLFGPVGSGKTTTVNVYSDLTVNSKELSMLKE